MKVTLHLTAAFIILACSFAYAQGPLGVSPIYQQREDEQIGGRAVSAEDAEKTEKQKLSWFEKQLKISSLSEKKGVLHQKNISQIYKRLSENINYEKSYRLQRFLEIASKVEEIGNEVASYGEHLILQKDGSYTRYYDGKPTDIFNLKEKDNFGNTSIVNILDMEFLTDDNFIVDNTTTTAHLLDYTKLSYDPLGAIDYLQFQDAAYQSNIGDRPSSYTTTEGAVEQTDALSIYSPDSLASARDLYHKLVNEIKPAVEAALTYTVTTSFSNIEYYNSNQDTATSTSAGGAYGEKASYDYTQESTDAPDVKEEGSVTDITYYRFDKPFTEPLDIYWWHAQDADTRYLHYGTEVKEASSRTTFTRLGITKEIDFYDAAYDTADNHNVLTSFKETHKIAGTDIARYSYTDTSYDSYGRKTSYNLSADIYGQPVNREYSGIVHDNLSRITGYKMKETIDGVTTTYIYWDIVYNNLWQQSSYYYSVDGIEHWRSEITYNSFGLVESYTDTYTDEDGVNVTTFRTNTYNDNGLLIEYTENILRQSSTVTEFYYVYVGNITYNNIFAITSYDGITIRDTNATTVTDYAAKIPMLLASFTFDGQTTTINSVWSDWGFNNTTTVFLEKWRDLTYYSVGSYGSGNFYDLALGSFQGRLDSYSEALRTTDNSSDTIQVIIL